MNHTFKNAQLQSVFLRRQGARAGKAIEEAWHPTSKWSFALIEKNGELIVFAVFYILIAVVAGILIIRGGLPLTADSAPSIVFSAAVFGAFLELLRRIYDTAVKRLAVIDLFTSEMFNILRAFAAANIIGQFARLYDIVDIESERQLDTAGPPAMAGVAHSAGGENYFNIFQSSSTDLSLLDPAVINDITAFYTFLKTARDATGAFRFWNDPTYGAARMKEDVVNVVYLCFLMTTHGMRALEGVVVSPDNWKLIEDIAAGVLLQGFTFLDSVVSHDDFRRPRIEQRRKACADLRRTYAYQFGPAELA